MQLIYTQIYLKKVYYIFNPDHVDRAACKKMYSDF